MIHSRIKYVLSANSQYELKERRFFFHFKAVFLNQLSHATKVSVTWDMGQNSGRTEGPVTRDWPNQSKWYSSPTQDSPKKARAKEPFTPSKISKSAHLLIFDTAIPFLIA